MTGYHKLIKTVGIMSLSLLSTSPVLAQAFDPLTHSIMKISQESSETESNTKSVRGVVKPNAQAVIATDLVAKIAKITVKEGDHFKKGDLLVSFDCGRYYADLQAARAEYRAEAITYKTNMRLNKRRAIGRSEVNIAKAKMERAAAAVVGIKVKTTDCKIEAPFSGRVVEKKANQYEFSSPDKPLFTLLDDSSLEIDLIVPSRWLNWLKTGSQFSFLVDENAKTYPASIIRIGASVDAVSQTIKITGRFRKKPHDVLSGMSGTALFNDKNDVIALK